MRENVIRGILAFAHPRAGTTRRRSTLILSDTLIREYLRLGHLAIDPLDDPDRQIQPASVDLRLHPELGIFHPAAGRHVDPADKAGMAATMARALEYRTIGDEGYLLQPGDFVLARTIERVAIPGEASQVLQSAIDGAHFREIADLPALVGRIEGRSSLGRLGIAIHVTAGYIDPGFAGTITLELKHQGVLPVLLRPGMRFCQLSLLTTGPVDRPYGHAQLGSKYQGQEATTASLGL